MNESHTFRASKKKALLLLLGSLVFVALGVLMSEEKPLIGWLCAGFFGLGIPASLFMMLPNAMFLRLDREGFEMGSMFGSQKVLWAEVNGFQISSIRGAKMIEILYNENYTRQKVGRAVASAMSGMEGAIANNYNASLDEVLNTLRSWKERYAE
jgi:hypothetical protein